MFRKADSEKSLDALQDSDRSCTGSEVAVWPEDVTAASQGHAHHCPQKGRVTRPGRGDRSWEIAPVHFSQPLSSSRLSDTHTPVDITSRTIVIVTGWIVMSKPLLPPLAIHIEVLTPTPQNVAVFGDKLSKEVTKLNEVLGWALIPYNGCS